VGNAIKFTDAGQVEIDVYPLQGGSPDQLRLLFSVSDTGIGIEDGMLEKLFAPFTQAENKYTRKYQGAGLGLAISKRLIGLMGGNMAVTSEAGKGTAFYFCISFGLGQSPAVAIARAKTPSKAGCRVLLAEDDDISVVIARKLLEKEGCEVLVAKDGQQALDYLDGNVFDLVLMDIQMPKLNGLEATKAIRDGKAGPGNLDVPIVAFTSYAMTGDREMCIEAGMDDYLSKPLNSDEFKAVLDRFLGAAG
jgi:CheY-like chemotaxis protein